MRSPNRDTARNAGFSLLAVLVLAALACGPATAPPETGGPEMARPSPVPALDFDLELLGGGRARLAQYRGQLLLLDFWATWCRSCVKEVGVLDAEAQRCAEDPVRVLAVNVGDEADEIRAFLADRPISIPILRDAKGKIWRDVSGLGLPANLFWTGDEQRVEVGPLSLADWRRELEGLGCAPPS